MIKVLIVEDSQVVRELLTFILSADPAIQVIGTARDGREAVRAVREKKPNVVTMDIIMPNMDGFEATRIIMETTPTPIVIVSASWDPKEVKKTFRAMEAGALTAIEKPVGIAHPNYKKLSKELIRTVKLMSEVKVIRRRPQRQSEISGKSTAGMITAMAPELEVVAIGASTGGPPAIEAILSKLPKDFPAPLLIVQHIAAGFVHGFADWLANASKRSVKIAAHGEYLLPGCAYVAPDDFQMGVGSGRRIILSSSEPENGLRPSVSWMFRSVSEVFGKNAIGVLLTGMGKDGAQELKQMRQRGAVTIAQDRESSVVYGMPGEAVAINAAAYVLSPAEIAKFLSGLPRTKNERAMIQETRSGARE
ncbi:MAG: chemotaxis response regulator protein-glutamate methylesterase [Desulfobacterales bacterium]|nr:chemotaxis response regulator protein-glutamate methylesterase [Desulfobacterales bacterium]